MIALGQEVLAKREFLPTNESNGLATKFSVADEKNFPVGMRKNLVLSESRMTTVDNQSHLLSFGEFAAMYLYAWNNELWQPAAIKDFDQALKLGPDNINALMHRGVAYGANGDYERGFADLNRAIEISPDFGKAYYYRGVLYTLRGSSDRALADYGEAVRLEPQNPEGLIGRAGIYVRLGDMDGAITDYNAAIKLQPADPALYYNRGFALFNKGEYEKALQEMQSLALDVRIEGESGLEAAAREDDDLLRAAEELGIDLSGAPMTEEDELEAEAQAAKAAAAEGEGESEVEPSLWPLGESFPSSSTFFGER